MSHIEQQNLTMRVGMRHFTRLTNAFSKRQKTTPRRLPSICITTSFAHKALHMTSAMAAGLVDTAWEVEDIVALVEKAEDAAPKKHGPTNLAQKMIFQSDSRPSVQRVLHSFNSRSKSAQVPR